MKWGITDIRHALGSVQVTNDDLRAAHPEWDVDLAAIRTGVNNRHHVHSNTTAFDLAEKAVSQLIEMNDIEIDKIGGIICCTSMSDYIFPGNSQILHGRFNLRENALAFDINLACSGFPYALGVAKSFLQSGDYDNIIVVTGDTYSKLIHENDRSTMLLFSDGVAATLLTRGSCRMTFIDALYFSSGKDHERFMVRNGGFRTPLDRNINPDSQDSLENYIQMDGLGILSFFNTKLPEAIDAILLRNQLSIDDLKLIVPHQASQLALAGLIEHYPEHKHKFFINMADIGNLTSASIPVAIQQVFAKKDLQIGDRVLLVGFGVGLSWSTMLMRIEDVGY